MHQLGNPSPRRGRAAPARPGRARPRSVRGLGESGSLLRRAAAKHLLGLAAQLRLPGARGSVDQPRFLNAALELETDLSPLDLLAELKRLELAIGREPGGRRWGPRVIDLDILSFDGRCVTDPEHALIVPHPRFHERRFALEPVAELDPGLLPWRNCSDLRVEVSVIDLLATVADQEVFRVGGPDWADPQSRS
jgi:2-amino-4-hydroxy-6-hydroxymethyldihydropteridine diphosphokinase